MKPSLARLSARLRLVVVCAALFAVFAPALKTAADELSATATAQLQALQEEKNARSPAERKMDSQLVYGLKLSTNPVVAPGVTSFRVMLPKEADGRVWIDLKATVSSELLNMIQTNGGTVLNSFPQYQAVRALVPIRLTETLAARSDVQFVRAAVPAIKYTGSVDSEGDTTHRAITARPNFLVDGTGVRVGVLSDSVDYMAQAQATGDLPSDLVVLPGQAGSGAGEGTAMLEIVYDLAPGAKLDFATAFNSEASFAQNIIDLQAAGCNIIADDVYYADESPFQDGIVAQAVNTVTTRGAMYFSAAGNSGNLRDGTSGVWEGDFVNGGAAPAPVNGKQGFIHSFGTATADTLSMAGSWVTLFWSDPLGASTNDYDLYLLDATGANVVASSTTVQNGLQDPFEYVPMPNAGERVVVVQATGDARYLHLDTGGGQFAIGTTGAIKGHAAATNAVAVAATSALNSYPNPFTGGAVNAVETFSSDGPRHVFYNPDGTAITPGNVSGSGGAVRQKPDLTAADGVSTTLPPLSGLNPFYGTSCATPHAAAMAALLMSYSPNLAPSQVFNLMTNSALDIEGPGWDINSGAGIAMAYQALQIAPPPAALPKFIITSNILSGGNGSGLPGKNECDNLNIIVANVGRATATTVRATLFTLTPGTAIAQPSSNYPDLPIYAAATNLTAFKLSISSTFACGTSIQLMLVIKSDEITSTNYLSLPTGVPGKPLRYDNSTPAFIPDVSDTNSVVVVSNLTYAINKVTVSMYITHTYDSDLVIQLVAPDGTTCTLSQNEGGAGENYGFACSPDGYRTTFDDASTIPISQGNAPFVGTFAPEQPLLAFSGKSGTNINGAWRLHVSDTAQLDTGTIQCWSLLITPTVCADGGGECPGADMGIGMTAQPEPVVLGGYLTYNISVTNFGPSSAKNALVSQVLPGTVSFASASPSQGSVAVSSNLLTWSLGQVNSAGIATLAVRVLPSVAGLISSSVTVSSEQPDANLANNSATVFSHVTPPSADIAVGLSATPNPTVVGGALTYNVTVTNNGPYAANAVVVTNLLPATVIIGSATISQGAVTTAGQTVVGLIGNLAVGAKATLSIPVTPVVVGTIVATATGSSAYADPVPANNSASVTTVVGPSADLALTFTGLPDPVISQSNLTYTLLVTNLGPSDASGVVINGSLPPGVLWVSDSTTGDPIVYQGNNFIASLGFLQAGTGGAVTITVATPEADSNLVITATAVVTGDQFDPNSTNNSSTVTTLVAPPFISVVPAGATLTYESGPTNGAIDIGETVTVAPRLRNVGNINTINLMATLLATNGVTPIPTNQSRIYGVLTNGGLSIVTQPFTFRANGLNGGKISAVLHLVDNAANDLGLVSFTFVLPNTVVFTNSAYITIPEYGSAMPAYPSAILVSGITGTVGRVTATLSNLSHTFPTDIDALLVAPSGRNTILMSDAGAPFLTDVNVTFDDNAAAPVPDGNGQILSGSYQPVDYLPGRNLLAPAPAGPYPTAMSVFNGANPNGTWLLYVDDQQPGDDGYIAGGWSLAVTLISPVNQLADLGITGVAVPNPVLAGSSCTNTFTITNNGPSAVQAVAFNDSLPAGVSQVSASASQGSLSLVGGTNVSGTLGTLNVGATLTVTVVMTAPVASGALTSIANVSALSGEIDLAPLNNSIALSASLILPVATLTLSQTAAPAPVTVSSNVTYVLSVTNKGPGLAFNTRVADLLPGLTNFTVSLGNLPANASTNFAFVVTPQMVRPLTNTASVGTDSTNPNAANSVTNVVQVTALAPRIVPGATALTYESGPINGAIDPGETVTVSLTLTNVGSAGTSSSFTATLLAGGGVTTPSGNGNYGALAPGQSRALPFRFTASGVSGGVITATLQLQDGSNNLGTVAFTFTLSAKATYANALPITIPDHGIASPYPSAIVVSNVTGTITKATVTLNGLSHTSVQDVNVLLVSPAGASVLLMSHVGGFLPVTNLSLTFDDAAAGMMTNNGGIVSGTNRASAYGGVTFPYVAGPYGSALSAVNWSNPNGIWSLYVLDDSPGDAGVISGGWSLNLVTATTLNPLVDLAVTISSTPAAVFTGSTVTNIITVTNLGPVAATGVYVTQYLPAGVSFLPKYSQGVLDNGSVTSSLGSLPVGGTARATIVTAPSLGGVITNFVSVSADQETLNPAHSSAQSLTTVYVPNPAILSGSVEDGAFQLEVTAQPGLTYVIQASTDLSVWAPIATNTANTSGTIEFTNSTSVPYRFFRTKLLTP